MFHNFYHLKMSCNLTYTKNNLISSHFQNLFHLLVSQCASHLSANFPQNTWSILYRQMDLLMQSKMNHGNKYICGGCCW